jgi:uncharacterized protein YicC (UPF0701 family)
MSDRQTPPLVRWKYNSWRTLSTAAEQLARLHLHIQEVEGFVLEASEKGRTLKLQEQYLDRLETHVSRLESQVQISAAAGHIGRVSSFVRGDGP